MESLPVDKVKQTGAKAIDMLDHRRLMMTSSVCTGRLWCQPFHCWRLAHIFALLEASTV